MYTNHNYDHDFYDDFERHNTIYHRSLSYLTSVNGGDTINDNYNDNDGGADGSSDDESSLSLVSPTGLVVGFSLIAAAFLITAVCIVRCNWHCKEFYEWNGIRIIMPGMCVLLAIKNAAMAYDYERPKASSHLSILVYMISSTIAPGESFVPSLLVSLRCVALHKKKQNQRKRKKNTAGPFSSFVFYFVSFFAEQTTLVRPFLCMLLIQRNGWCCCRKIEKNINMYT